MWFVYIINADDDSLYTGITTDIQARFHAHKNKRGAKYFYARRPVCVCYVECCDNKSHASKREFAIKKLTRTQKLGLIEDWAKNAPLIPLNN